MRARQELTPLPYPRGLALWPAEPERRTLVIAFAAPFAFAVLIAVVSIVLLSSPLVTIPRLAAVRLLALAVVFPLLMLALSPLIALGLHLNGVPDKGRDYRAVAQAVEHIWRAHTDQPLRIVGSTTFVNGIVFYFKNQPSTLDIDNPKLTPWVGVDRIRREGGIIVCPETDAFCMRALRGYTAFYSVVADEDVVVSRRFFGVASVPARYEIIMIPPEPSQGMHSAIAPER